MSLFDRLQERLPVLFERIGYRFQDPSGLVLALIHRSFVNEWRQGGLGHNERLEFLGDSVLGLIVSNYLFQRLPDHSEGELSKLRSQIVEAQSCARCLMRLGLHDEILLGRGEKNGLEKLRISIFADVFEALLGAIYLDGGFATVQEFFLHHFQELMEEVIDHPARNFKAELQDFSQKKVQKPPLYKVVLEEGPDHAKIFHVAVFIGEDQLGMGVGLSKKQAEQRAAEQALNRPL
jgi:ribonuclease-3